jgi:hypothetical protein
LKASKGIQSYEISIWAAKAEYDDDIETIFHKMSVLFLQKREKITISAQLQYFIPQFQQYCKFQHAFSIYLIHCQKNARKIPCSATCDLDAKDNGMEFSVLSNSWC